MEVLNAAVLTPISLHKPTYSSERRAEPNKPFHYSKLSRNFSASLAAFSSVLCTNALAKALTYEEALSQSVNTSSSSGSSFVDGIVGFGSENPLIIGGGAVVVIVPLILSQILKKPEGFGVENAKNAFAKLSEDADAQLLDIREGKDLKEVGGPDVRSLKKKAVSVPFIREDKPGFLKKLSLKFKDPGSTTLFILDKFDGNSELVAELVTANGFKAAYAIKDGAEGARGWMNSGLPWIPPKKTLSLDFGDLIDAITNTLSEGPDGLPAALGLAAATGAGLFAFTEMDTLLQLLGSAAIVQFATKKLLFAQDRKVTLQQIDEFLTTKIAPKELVGELKMIGKALLPAAISTKASLPAPTEAKPDTSTSATPLKADAVPETKSEPKEEAAAEPPPMVNSVPKAAVSEGSLSGLSRPLSPYPNYPDFKPPSSPSPAKP